MKLNVGCGTEKLDGYTSVDLFVPADIKDDVTTLKTIADNSVEEVRMFHLLEHLKHEDVPLAIASAFRVLKSGGLYKIEVPDLIWLFQDFLNTPEDQRWGWKIQTIFGMQCNDGEYHKTGFSSERIADLIKQAGFINIKIDPSFSDKYNQGIIDVEATKP